MAKGHRWARGSRIMKVEPLPGSLSTVMSPPSPATRQVMRGAPIREGLGAPQSQPLIRMPQSARQSVSNSVISIPRTRSVPP